MFWMMKSMIQRGLSHAVLITTILLTAATGASSQSKDPFAALRTTSTDPTAKLTSTMEIVEQKYCSDSRMYLKLRTTYRNVGMVPILLYNANKVGYRWRIRQVAGDMRKGFTSVVEPMFELNSLVKWGQEPEKEKFTKLDTGEAMTEIWSGGIAIDLHDYNRESGLRAGQYTLTMTDMTWFYPFESIEPYFKKWREKGALWWTDIISEPMPFTVVKPKKAQIEKCVY